MPVTVENRLADLDAVPAGIVLGSLGVGLILKKLLVKA